MDTLLYSLDGLLFTLFLVWILYILIFAVAYRLPMVVQLRHNKNLKRYLVVFPAYKEDAVIVASIENFLQQSYPASLYQVAVVADSLREETLKALKSKSIQVIIPSYTKRSKALALSLAVSSNQGVHFDAVVILDADNHVDRDFLVRINEVFLGDNLAIQAHRVAKNQNTPIAYLDGLSEELNNSIFRQGHNNIGLPAALSGSGMVFNMNWFQKAIKSIDSVGEDKELELLLLINKINTKYLEDVFVYDEKTSKNKDFSQQRKRWIAAQLDIFLKIAKDFTVILKNRDWARFDKLIQWSMPPRILLLGWFPLWIFILFFVQTSLIWKWMILYFLFFIALLLALPNRYYTRKTCWALLKLPGLLFATLRSLIGLKSARTTFIHTPHGDS